MWHKISISRTGLSLATALTLLLALSAVARASHTQSGTWLAPTVLGEAPNGGCVSCEFEGAAMNQSGDAAVAWTGSGLTTTGAATRERGGDWVRYADISDGKGASDGVQVEMDSAGNAYAVWIYSSQGWFAPTHVRAATYKAGLGWQPSVDITSLNGNQVWFPNLAVDSEDGSATAVWYQSDSGAVWSSSLAPGGTSEWSQPQIISNQGRLPDVGMDAGGNATAIWEANDESGVERAFVATRPPGRDSEWTDYRPISPRAHPPVADPADAHLVISVNQDGDAGAAWVSETHRRSATWATARSGGQWQGAQMLRPRGGFVSAYPKVAVDGNGTATVAWETAIEGPLGYTIKSSEHVGNGAWSAAQTIAPDFPPFLVDPISLADPYASSYRPQISWLSTWLPPKAYGATRNVDGNTWDTSVLKDRGVSFGSEMAGDGQGDAATILQSNVGKGLYVFQAVGYDDAGPRQDSVVVPCSGTTGEPVSFSVDRTDVWSQVASDVWEFGDGEAGEGQQVEHTYQQAGTYDVSVTSTDSLGHPTNSPVQEIKIADPENGKHAPRCVVR